MADQDWFAQNAPGQPQQPAAAQPPAEAQQPAPTQAVTQPAQNTQNDDWFAANAPASATPPTQPGDTTPSKQKEDTRSMWEKIKSAVAGPNTALSTPLGQTPSQEISGVNDIIHGEFAKGGHKIWDAEKIGAHNVMPGSPVEWAIRQFNPDFHGTATKEYIAAEKAKNPNPGEKPLIDISQFLDKKEHPIAKAIAEVGEGFTSPNNLAIMYSTGGLGLIGKTPQALKAFKVTQKLISAGFAYQALNSAYTHSEAFKDAMDNGDEAEAEYQLTHALAGGTIALQAGSHAAEGVNVPGTKITPVKETMPFMSDLDKAVIGKTAEVVGKAAQNTSEFAKQKLTDAADAMGRVVGRTDDFSTAVTSVANKLGKKVGPEFRDKVERVSDDLKDIINNDVDNKIVDPKTAADAIDQHLNSLEAPLQAEAGATKDSTEPVVPNFTQRLAERLDKFFDDNRQKYGSADEVNAIKERIIDRLTGEHDVGDGTKVPRDINLYEAENARQGLSKSSGDVFENGTSSGYRAASADAANFLREVIDESYNAKGVSNVKEARAKEADLIDVRDALRDAQGAFEKQNNMPALLKLFSVGKLVGLIGTIGAHFFGGNVLGGTVAAGTAWKAAHEHFTQNIASNLGRAQDLAAREPGAQATVPGSVPPTQGPQVGPPTAPLPPGVPPPPTPPTPATPPAVNHALNGTLSSYFGNFLNEEPYDVLMQKFVNQVADMKQDVAAAKADPNYKPKYTQEQIDRAMKVQDRVNTEHAKEHAQVEKQNTAAQAKYQKELAKYNQDARVKAEEIRIKEEEQAAKNKAEAEAAEEARVKKIKEDPRVAHSPLMFATDSAFEINGVEGRASREAHRHEHGHIMANVAEGLNPLTFVTEDHPDAIESGAAAQVHTDVSGAEEGPKGLAQRVVGILGGPAFDEVHQGISLGRNTGARGDISRAREILREEGGLRGNQLEKVFDALYERAKEHVSNPEAHTLVEANADLRESGLHKTVHMSNGRMEAYVKLLKGAYRNGETPSTEGVREGDSDGAVPEGKSAGAGDGGGEQDGAVEGPRAEAAPKTGKESAESGEPERITDDDSDYKAGVIAAAEHGGYLTTTGLQRELANGIGFGKAARIIDRLRKEGHVNSERSNLQKALPPERSTGDVAADEAIKKGGGIPGGTMEGFPYKEGNETRQYPDTHLFHDPESGTTLALKKGEVTPEAVAEKLANSRRQYAGAKLPKEDFQGVHFSGVPAEEGVVRGNTRGTAKAGSEQARVALGAEPGVYAYREGARFEPQIASRQNKYSISGKKSIADISGEQKDLFQGAFQKAFDSAKSGGDNDTTASHKGMNAGETAVKNAGYDGYENKEYPGSTFLFGDQKVQPHVDTQITAHNSNGGSTFSPDGKNLAGTEGYSVAPYPERSKIVDELTPKVLSDYKAANADLLNDGQHAVGTWKDPDTGKTYLDITKTIADRDAAVKAGQDANQKAIYNLKTGETVDTGGTGEAPAVEKSALTKGSSVPLMENPLKVKGTGEGDKISTLDVAKALNKYSTKQHPALELDEAEPKEMVDRAKKIAEDEAKYQLAQGKTGTEWYTTEMKEHDDALKSVRPEFEGGEPIDAPTAWPHNAKLSLFKAAEAILSSGQKPYGNFKSAVKAWDIYNETGEFPRTQPDGKSWGPRGAAAYGNAMGMLNTLVGEKGEKGAAEWLLSDHPVSELKQYNKDVKGKKTDEVPGAMILGAKRGPFMRNLHGIESAFTADMWVTRTWNRWMGTMEAGTNSFTGEPEIQPSAPRNNTERDLMHKSFSETADKLGLSTSSLQAVLWYYEQALYSKQGIPKESWSFRDAAKRAVSEMPKGEEAESFNFGNNPTDNKAAGFASMVRSNPAKFVNLKK